MVWAEVRYQTPVPDFGIDEGLDFDSDVTFRFLVEAYNNAGFIEKVGTVNVGRSRRGVFGFSHLWNLDLNGNGIVEPGETDVFSLRLRDRFLTRTPNSGSGQEIQAVLPRVHRRSLCALWRCELR